MVTWVAFGPPIIASSIAFLIAVIVYSRQKKRDRELPLQAVKRAIYGEFFASVETLYQHAGKGSPEDFQGLLTNTLCIYNNFVFSAPITVISPCRMAILCVEVFDYNCRQEGELGPEEKALEIQTASTEAKRAIRTVLKSMREDLLGASGASSDYAVNLVYGQKALDYLEDNP